MYRQYLSYVTPRNILIAAAGISAAVLAGAHAFERIGGLAPCLLCLEQREVHWTALTIALITLVATQIIKADRVMAAGLVGLTVAYIFSTWVAGFHAGVEWGLWPGPAACSGAGVSAAPVSGDDILHSLNNPKPLAGPPCEVAAWRLFGLSMAGYNVLISLSMAALSAYGGMIMLRKMFFTPKLDEALR